MVVYGNDIIQEEKLFLKLTGQDLSKFDGNWNDNDAEQEFEFYKAVAKILINNYLQRDLDEDEARYFNIEDVYTEQTILLASHVYNIHATIVSSNQNQGIKSISSNGRSVQFMDAMELSNQVSIPQYIKDMLPKPKSTAKVKVW